MLSGGVAAEEKNVLHHRCEASVDSLGAMPASSPAGSEGPIP